MKMFKICLTITMAAFFFVVATTVGAQKEQLAQKKVLTLTIAKQIAAAAEKEACKPRCQGVIAIVDDGGYILFVERLEDTDVPSVDLAIGKARTAALYQRPTKTFRDNIAQGQTFYSEFPNMLAVNGGIPLVVDGHVVGAIGVSGNMQGASGGRTEPITAAAVDALAKIIAH